jgi:peptide/nickel transport system permease protein
MPLLRRLSFAPIVWVVVAAVQPDVRAHSAGVLLRRRAALGAAPWDWFRQLLVPWIVLAAPLGAMCLRLTLSITREAMDEDFVRTAEAKGVSSNDIVRRHAAPLSYPGTLSLIAVSAPLLITNMVLIERVFSVPGFFRYTWRAAGHANFSFNVKSNPPLPDFPLLCALGLWTAVLLIVIGLVADWLMSLIDPHVRTSAAQAW